MKTFLKIMLLSTAVTFVSCSSEDKVTTEGKEQFNPDIVPDLSQLKMGAPGVFFTYNDSKDAGVNLIKAIDELQLEVNDAMLDNPKITAHQFAITMSSGKAILESLFYYDEKNGVLIDNPIKPKGNKSIPPGFVSGALYGSCPSGWTKIGTYGLTAQDQFGKDVKAVLSDALSSSNGCIELHISRGLLSATACKRSCP
jgi:hypothetical protein